MQAKAVRRPLDASAAGIMLVLCFCWGFQQVAIKLAAPDVSTVMQIAIRCGFVALVLGVYLLVRGGMKQFRDGTVGPGMLIGVLFSLEFLFVALALQYTLASHVSVFLYTSPIFAALGLHIRLPEERLNTWQWGGVALAFGGAVVAFLGGNEGSTAAPNVLLGDMLALAGGAAWGLTTVVIRGTRLSEIPAAKALFYQVLVAVVLHGLFALATGSTRVVWTPVSIASLTFQSVLVTLGTFLVWFWLLRRYLASRLSILSFMTPLFGVAMGVAVLHEPITANFGIGAVLVLIGICVVSGAELLGAKKAG